jgi:hypothetical protein
MKLTKCCLPSEMDTSYYCLHAVSIHEDEVYNITMEALTSFDTNLIGPHSYLKMYEAYIQILNGEAESAMITFMKTDPFPSLKVCEIKLLLHSKSAIWLYLMYDCIGVC